MRTKIVVLCLCSVFVLLGTIGYARPINRIVSVDVVTDEGQIGVRVRCDSGGWLGCSVYTRDGRVDLYPEYLVEIDTIFFELPSRAYKVVVALWEEKYDYGEGPDPDNPWAEENGYYLWGELDRVEVSRGDRNWH